MTAARSRRSFIFMPGLKPEMFPKAVSSEADIVCIDLEDAIHPRDKAVARERTFELLASRPGSGATEIVLRINSLATSEGLKDLAAVIDAGRCGPPSLMLPKVASREQVALVAEHLDAAGLDTTLHVIIESAEGMENAADIARSGPRLQSLFFGAVDYSSDIGAANTWEAMLFARSRVVQAAAIAGLDAIDVPWLDLDDEAGMRAEAEASRAVGFVGKGAIHPRQIPVIHDVFSPSPADIEEARRIVEAFDEAATGLVVIDGKLIERPVLRAMERILEQARRMG